jgi:hypothetical protein
MITQEAVNGILYEDLGCSDSHCATLADFTTSPHYLIMPINIKQVHIGNLYRWFPPNKFL